MLVSKNKEWALKLGGKTFFPQGDKRGWLIEAKVDDIEDFRISSIPHNLQILLYEFKETDFAGYVTSLYIRSSKKHFGIGNVQVLIDVEEWNHKFEARHYLDAMKKALEKHQESNDNI